MESLTDRLKEATGERHLRMEALPFVAALSNGTLPLESYTAQLRAMAVIHAALEYELNRNRLPHLTALFQPRPSRLAHLRADLGALDRFSTPDCLAAAGHAQRIAGLIRQTCGGHPEVLTGYLYVLEGMTLGNAMHLPDAVNCFGDRLCGASRYYGGYGDRTAGCWQEFRAAVDAVPVSEQNADVIIEAALTLFDLLEPLYASLCPVPKEGWGNTAAMLNPEAGKHPVPESAAEIQAAESAARRCREEFPYFDERYRERGQAFARSDAAWLVTLKGLPQEQLLGQVEWLGRVLGNRGMPRITLERQLLLLCDELGQSLRDRSAAGEGLRQAAMQLQAERFSYLPEPVFRELAQRFCDATDGEQQGRFKGTGELIAAAVCDEAAGISAAVTSLVSWLTEEERFPEAWVKAVEDSVEAARSVLVRPTC